MGSFHTNPLVLRLADELAGLIGHGAGLALDHVADINLVADDALHSGIRPFVVDTAGIALAFPLIVQHARWLDAFLVEGNRYGMEAHAGGPHSKEPAHGGCRILVNDKVMFVCGVPLVTVGRIGPHEFSAFRAGFFHSLDLLAGIPAIKFVK